MKIMGPKRIIIMAGVVSILSLAIVPTASAGIHTLEDGGSTATFNDASQGGMTNWSVNNVNQVFQQWFWYRIGPTGPEHSIDTLTLTSAIVSDTNGSGFDNVLFLRYEDLVAGFEIEVSFSLDGVSGGVFAADMAEQITITNTTASPLDFHFFQYTDFDLGGTPGNDQLTVLNANTWIQEDTLSGAQFAEVVATPGPDHFQGTLFDTLLLLLNDGTADTLDGTGGNLFGNPTFGWQWDFNIAGFGAEQISKDKMLSIPLPGALLLGSLGLGMVGWVKRKFA